MHNILYLQYGEENQNKRMLYELSAIYKLLVIGEYVTLEPNDVDVVGELTNTFANKGL